MTVNESLTARVRLEAVSFGIAPPQTSFFLLYSRFLRTPAQFHLYQGHADLAEVVVDWIVEQDFGFEVYEQIIRPGDKFPDSDRIMINGDGVYQYLYLGLHEPSEAVFFQFRWRGIKYA
jgi:hypothetical protein